MKKYLLAVLLLAGCHAAFLTGCKSKGTNRIEINGQVIEGENITISQSNEDSGEVWILHENPFKWPKDTVYIHDTVHHFYYKSPPYNVETHGDNSPAIISDKPVNIKY